MKKLILTFAAVVVSVTAFAQNAGKSMLNPTNHALVLIDHEGQMAFATKSISMEELRNNVALISGGSKIFNIPTVVTTVAEKSFAGPVFPEISEVYPEATSGYVDRTTMNTWEDVNAHKAITGKNKKKLVLAGLWTSVCVVGPALSAIDEGYEVYIITDASGDISKEAHDQAVTRMVQAGARPITSVQYVLELQRDWSRKETYKPVNDLMKKYGGAYGLGIQYAQDMLKH
ncbi:MULTISPECIES: hydrolase [unclassified Chryseobacterium]|uniref:hydrolase n=1 Tax=unclassified Chryseobacterium TaxID=2593645 RepID=UPI00100AE458|nr:MULTISPECIES: hydrolase [unclassified Chryseobacterium]RXM50545.1 hydrolase [Chryseobacterium sp. CH25]RXM63179.1 hydrolase [Chryseobacterium sp. CH1]